MSIANHLDNDLAVASTNELTRVQTVQSILGANLKVFWSARDATLVSGEVSSVADRVIGMSLAAPGASQRPSYNAADPDFGGAASIRTRFTTAETYLGATMTAPQANHISDTGAHNLFTFCVARVTAPGPQANDKCLMQLTLFGGATDRNMRCTLGTGGNLRTAFFNGATTTHVGNPVDGATHLLTSYAQGSQVHNSIDGVVASTALVSGVSTWTGPSPNGQVFLGIRNTLAEWIDARYALWGVCLNPPSASELALLLQHVRSNYGVAA